MTTSRLQEYIKAIDATSATQIVLTLVYFLEHERGKAWVSVAEIRDCFTEARIGLPSNLHDVVAKIARQDPLIVDKKVSPFKYQLSLAGTEWIEEKLKPAGVLNIPKEESRLLKEISESLEGSVKEIPDLDERGYIQEALSCLSDQTKAYRAAVLMGWASAIYHLRKKVDEQGFDKFCQAYQSLSLGKPKHISNIDDLEFCKDKDFLLVLERMNIFDKSVRQQLENCLDLRNGCAHPTQIKPRIQRVKAFFEDIIEYVLSQ